MIKTDENALICDLAETYNIYNYKQLPPFQVAIFAIGLREDSRIKMKLSGSKITPETMLLAGILDRLSILVWQKTEDGAKGRNKPKSVLDILTDKNKESDVSAFTSGKEFEEERNRLIKAAERR